MLNINVSSRVHFGLFDLAGKGYRTNGGIGLSLRDYSAVVRGTPYHINVVEDHRTYPIDDEARAALVKKLDEIVEKYDFKKSLNVSINGSMRTHFGFGSGTAIALATIESLFLINQCRVSKEKLIELSGRGGTSGIGINTYFGGGLVVDLGRYGKDEQARPSSDWTTFNLPMMLCRTEFPNWSLVAAIAHDANPISKTQERRIFAEALPVSEQSVRNTIYHALFGLYAGVRENRLEDFCTGLCELQKSEWKSAEWDLQSNATFSLRDSLYDYGAKAVGLSSLGPMMIGVFGNSADAESSLSIDKATIVVTEGCNSGRTISSSS